MTPQSSGEHMTHFTIVFFYSFSHVETHVICSSIESSILVKLGKIFFQCIAFCVFDSASMNDRSNFEFMEDGCVWRINGLLEEDILFFIGLKKKKYSTSCN